MIKDGNIIYNNPVIDEMLKAQRSLMFLSRKDMVAKFKNQGRQKIGEGIMAGFLLGLNEVMAEQMEEDSWFTYTYESLGKLEAAMTEVYRAGKAKGYKEFNNAEILAKTMASAMSALAMNEHGYGLKVTKLSEQDMEYSLPWSDNLSIRVDGEKAVDFLTPAMEGLVYANIEVENGIYYSSTPLMKAYKAATGVDLAEKGLGDIVVRS